MTLAMLSAPELAQLRSHLGLGPTSRVLLFNTEGATAPDGFAAICGTSPTE